MGFFEGFKRGLDGDDTQHYSIAGTQVRCAHCGGQDFDTGKSLLNTTGLSLLGLDWANREATVLICTDCSHIDWFLEAPERI